MLFIDNIFRFTQAGSEVSALLGRSPLSGRLPTDPVQPEMGHSLQERITSTNKGSITSVQAIYVPADDSHRPGAGDAPSRTWMPPPCFRAISPPSASTPPSTRSIRPRRFFRPTWVGLEHYQTARQVQKICKETKNWSDIIAILGMDELSEDDKLTVSRAAQDSAFSLATLPRGPRPFTGQQGKYVEIKDTVRGFKEMDHRRQVRRHPPSRRSSLMGGIDEVRAAPRRWPKKASRS